MVELIQTSKQKHITTKSLAAYLGISEAGLYRHFPSKALMYESLIGFVESAIMKAINNTYAAELSGVKQATMIAQCLFDLSTTNPGMVLLLCGDFLTNEDSRLQEKVNDIFAKLQSMLKQPLKMAIAQKELPESYDVVHHADVLMSVITAHWFKFSKGVYIHNNADSQVVIAIALGLA